MKPNRIALYKGELYVLWAFENTKQNVSLLVASPYSPDGRLLV